MNPMLSNEGYILVFVYLLGLAQVFTWHGQILDKHTDTDNVTFH